MFKNFVTIAFRNMMRNKAYSFINLAGLSIGIACCLLLALYIQTELNYDKHHKDIDRIYRITSHFHGDMELKALPSCSPPVAMTMRDEVPEVEEAARVISPPGVSESLIKYDNNLFYESGAFIADSTLFEILTFEFVEGSPQKALTQPNTVVITDVIARKLFGDEPALNKVISIEYGYEPADFKITGVIKKHDSHLEPNFIVSLVTPGGIGEYVRSAEAQGEWAGQNFVVSYVKLRKNTNAQAAESRMNEVLSNHGAEDMKALGFNKTLALEPVKDIYLKSDIGRDPRVTRLYVVASVAIFILLIACINFMNLATAKATRRAGEIGMRKVMGAFRSSLITQILGEAMIIVLISIGISIVLVQLTLPFFNTLTGKSISLLSENALYFGTALIFIALFTGLVAGSYPAFYLSSFQPAQVLKGKFSLSNASSLLRKSLVVFQFLIAIVLVCGMIIISKQLTYMQEKDLGFDANHRMIVPLRTEAARKSYAALKSELMKSSFVKAVSAADYMPGTFVFNDLLLYPQGSSMDKAVYHPLNDVDYDYLDLLNIKLLAGRRFTNNKEAEQNKIIVSRKSVESFGFSPEEAIGQQLFMDWQGTTMQFEVIGVMENFHQNSLKETMKPIAFKMLRMEEWDDFENMVISLESGDASNAIAAVERIWTSVVNDSPFEYTFMEDELKEQYMEDKRLSRIIISFTMIAMFISCLGLYGLSSYMAERRFKEIGVRKVMGARVDEIVRLMSWEFIKLVVLAFIIAVPLAWYVMNKWLAGFAYRISIDAMIFVYAGVAALLIALLTISFESVRAAMGNPVNALRSE